jgi:hypothetical protein
MTGIRRGLPLSRSGRWALASLTHRTHEDSPLGRPLDLPPTWFAEVLLSQAVSSIGCRAMDQMKPASSRAMAVTALFLFIPRAVNFR